MDPVKALSIKTGSVRRLGADYRSYSVEHADYCRQLEAAAQSGDAHATKRAREFVDECYATRHDIGLRLSEACAALDAFMADHTELVGSQEWAKAQQTLQDNRPQPEQQPQQRDQPAQPQPQPQPQSQQQQQQQQQPTAAQQDGGPSSATSHYPVAPLSRTVPCPPPARFSVAVYGGSQAKPGDAAYERAKQLGQQLAQQQFHIVTTHTAHTAHTHTHTARTTHTQQAQQARYMQPVLLTACSLPAVCVVRTCVCVR